MRTVQPRVREKTNSQSIGMTASDGESARLSGSLYDLPMDDAPEAGLPSSLAFSDQLTAAPCSLIIENNEGVRQSLEPSLSKLQGLHFSSFDEAKSRLAEPKWTPPSVGVPRTPEEDQKCIRKLVEAFKNTDKALDRDENAYRLRFKNGYYLDESMEFCAWNILDLMKKLHDEGFRPYIFDKMTSQNAGATKLYTFERRLKEICDVLEISKYAAARILQGEAMLNLVYYPDKLYNGVISNAYSNGKRNSWIIKGRDADETHNPKPKRTKTEDGSASQDTSAQEYFKKDPTETKADVGGPAQFTPINQVPRSPVKLKLKKRGKMDPLNGVYFQSDSTAPATKPTSTPEATVTTASNTATPMVGVVATSGDDPNSTANPVQTNNLAKTPPADNVRPGTPNESGLSPQPASIFDTDVAECVEALDLLRNSTYIPYMNQKYKP